MDNRLFKKYGPTVLSCVASAGVIGTAILTYRARPKIEQLLEDVDEDNVHYKKDLAIGLVKVCIPPVTVGAGTIACIMGANILNKRQIASLVGSYALLAKSFDKYIEKSNEIFGEDTCDKIADAIAVETAKDMNLTSTGICSRCTTVPLADMGDKRLFYDRFSDRFFESTMENVLSAEYHLNRNFVLNGFNSLAEYFDFLGIDVRKGDENLGWSIWNNDIFWIDFSHRISELDDGTEYVTIEMPFEPWIGYEDE